MAFFNKNKTDRHNSGRTTRWVSLGKTEAEGEKDGLKKYYDDILHISDAIYDGKFIITGRKGVGKSAYVQYLMNNSGHEKDLFCKVITNDAIDLEKIIQSVPEGVGNRDEIVYEWIILTGFVQLILQSEIGKYTNEYNSLGKFQKKNSGLVDVEKWMVLEENVKDGYSVNFSSLLIKGFSTFFSKDFSQKTMRATFYKLIHPLREILAKMFGFQVYENCDFVLIFDDLDVNFNLNDINHKRRLLSLLRITKRYNTQIFTNKNVRVLNMLRDDISAQLDGVSPDKNKAFSSYEYNLNWYDFDKNGQETDTGLRKFINKRIKFAFDDLKIPYDRIDPWQTLVQNDASEAYRGKTAFKYILDFTFYRPRDLVALFRNISDKYYKMPLSPQDIKTLIKEYLPWNIAEIKDELSNLYNTMEFEKIFHVFRTMAVPNSQWTYSSILEIFTNEGLLEKDFNKMVEYNFIIPKSETNYQYFSYREKPRISRADNYFYCLPKCIYEYYNDNI